jgi:hypothetical protein
MKTCSKCQNSQSLDNFTKDKQKSDGLCGHCKSCRKAWSSKKYSENKDEILARNRAWQKENPDKKKAAATRYREENRASMIAYQREWRAKNPGKAASYTAKWREKVGLDRVNSDASLYRESNRQKTRDAALKWQKDNAGKVNAANAARYAAKLRATPKWFDIVSVEKIYLEAERLYKETGIPYDVDHVVPLRSKLVCGLHWHVNLIVIPATDNRRKGNRWWPDMPD